MLADAEWISNTDSGIHPIARQTAGLGRGARWMDPLTVVEQIVLDLMNLALKYVAKDKAADLLMQAARDQADVLENQKFPPNE